MLRNEPEYVQTFSVFAARQFRRASAALRNKLHDEACAAAQLPLGAANAPLVVVQEAAPRVVDALLAERWLSVCPTLQPLQRDTDGGADDVVNLDASQPQGAAPVACNPMVLSVVDGCIASHLAGADEVALAQVLGHLRNNFSAVEVDAALAELVRDVARFASRRASFDLDGDG